MKQLEFLFLCAVLMIGLLLPGCAAMNLGSTKIVYKDFTYESNKNQENLKATGKIGEDGQLEFDVTTTAVTPEAAIAASAAAQMRMIELLDRLLQRLPPVK